MVDVPVYNVEGEQIDTLQVDEQAFGGEVNADLIKQAVVTYHANRRQGTAATRNRGLISGTSQKAYRQKGTGRARRGDMKTNLLRGGGVAFAKKPRDFRKRLPKKMRRQALRSAILAKMLAEDLMVIDGLALDEPKTARLAGILRNLKINRTCLLALAARDRALYLSSRNIPDLTVRIAEELNAFDVMTRRKLLLTREAMDALTNPAAHAPAEAVDEETAELAAEVEAPAMAPADAPAPEPEPQPEAEAKPEADAEEPTPAAEGETPEADEAEDAAAPEADDAGEQDTDDAEAKE